MTQRQANTLTMWATVDAVLESRPKLWPSLQAFAKAVETFRYIRAQIDPDTRSQQTAITGITINKQNQRAHLSQIAAQLAANIQAYALVTSNHKLHDEVNYTISHFLHLRDNMLAIVARTLLDYASANQGVLTDYGVNEGIITELSAALTAFEQQQTAPRHAIISRKVAIGNIGQLIKQGNASIDVMSKLIGNFTSRDPDFVANFRNACHIIDRGHRKAKPGIGPITDPPVV